MNKLPFELKKREIKYIHKVKISPREKISGEELLKWGLVNLDKPAEITSTNTVEKVKGALEIGKAGHGGTLDPMVTGVLPIALNKATKVLRSLLLGGKKYEGTMRLHKEVSRDEIEEELKNYVGKIEQLPPVRSAVKRELREREIYYFNILEVRGKDIDFEVGTQAGTYVRKLCHDFGESLKTGAHMITLRRVQHGPFKVENSVTLEDLKTNYNKYVGSVDDKYLREILLPIESAVEHIPRIYIFDDAIDSLMHGSPIFVPGIAALSIDIEHNNLVAIFNLQSRLLGLGIAEMNTEEISNASKGLAIKTDSVFV